jgi:hypothetical protein
MTKGQAGLLLQELRQACRQPLFNGISDRTNSLVRGSDDGRMDSNNVEEFGFTGNSMMYSESETGSTTSSSHKNTTTTTPSSKRLRTSGGSVYSTNSLKRTRSWDLVRTKQTHP